jgi:large subunit ribosomal protein L30
MAKKIQITLVRSGSNRPETQKRTIRALGLRKMGSQNTVADNNAVRGMIRSVSHLVKIAAVE